MQINTIFKKDIFRSINGVVKAHQLDDSSVWQELDEFVFTRELDKYFRKFLSTYLEVMDNSNDPAITSKMGVWISGFFGSGKSHFLKVLSYLLGNIDLTSNGQNKQALEFFEEKVKDAMLLGDIKRAAGSDTEVILFNIDSKADSTSGRNAILSVFLKVLNEAQGYDGDHPHIAHMERYLDSKGKLKEFHDHYREITGTEWVDERDAYEFNRDQVVEAFMKTLGQSLETAEKWVDNSENNFSLTIENFSKWVMEYLELKGNSSRLVFLVDEIGQFIGTDGHLMLNLQTIAEDLGTMCKGRAWVIVTSQEDIDKVIGELRTASRNDFSKIQGRFQTRLSLSSANADEVIRKRILEKNEAVIDELKAIFNEKGDILRNQLSFRDCGMTLKSFSDADEFYKNYPFVPYQFLLLQKIFEVIRRVGVTGLHLAKGERSMLDAFQSAAKSVAMKEADVLVPLYEFYPSIDSFLDTTVKRTIEQASDNPSLEPYDIKLLQVLFLIRYVEEIKGNVDNLVTLCIDEIDTDRHLLRNKIEASLERLESETLISRSGDNYFFLTNEERDVSREIKGVELSTSDESRLLGEIIFEDILRGQKKHRYSKNKMDFQYTRLCDMFPVGNRLDGGLIISVISPLFDDYSLYGDSKCVLESSNEGGQILIRLRDDERLGRELRVYAQTEKYLKTKSDTGLPDTTKRILRDNADENRARREHLNKLLSDQIMEAAYFAAGSQLQIKASTPFSCVEEALEYLISNTFNKMSYLKHPNPEPLREIQAVLKSNDVTQLSLNLKLEENNPSAIDDVRNYIELCSIKNQAIIIHDMIEKRYSLRPYGWPEWEIILIVCRLLMLGEISLKMDGDTLPPDKVFENIKTPAKWRKITIHKRVTSDPAAMQKARKLGQDIFSEMGPDNEDALYAFYKEKLKLWESALNRFKPLAESGGYPGREEITEAVNLISPLINCNESYKLIQRVNDKKDDLLDLADEFHTLEQFYEHQKPTWDKLRSAYNRFKLNSLDIEQDKEAAGALQRMNEILTSKAPYGIIHEAEGLISTVEAVNISLLEQHKVDVMQVIDQFISEIEKEIDSVQGDGDLKYSCISSIESLKNNVNDLESIAHLEQMKQQAEKAFNDAFEKIEDYVKKKAESKQDGTKEPPKIKQRCVIKPSEYAVKSYLEDNDDINQFIDTLRKELEEAIKSGKRIQIK